MARPAKSKKPKKRITNSDAQVRELPTSIDKTFGVVGATGLQIQVQNKKKTWQVRIMNGNEYIRTEKLGDFEIEGSTENLTIEQAREKAKRVRNETLNPSSASLIKPSAYSDAKKFSDVASLWLNDYAITPKTGTTDKYNSEKTVRGYRRQLRLHILEEFKYDDFADIDQERCKNFLNALYLKTPAVADKCRQCLSMIFQFAEDKNIKPWNFRIAKFARYKSEEKIDKMPEDIRAEYAKCETLEDPIQRLATKLVHHIFLRASEIFSFQDEQRKLKKGVEITPKNIANIENFEVIKTLHSGYWSEIDFEKKLWTVPAIRMKMKRTHVVPLSIQALEILNEIYEITGKTGVIFPRATSLKNEEQTSIPAGYMGDWFEDAGISYNPHYCRTLANSWIGKLDDAKYDKAISIELAHVEGTKTKRAYDHNAYMNALNLRFEMMQIWSDFLEPRPNAIANQKTPKTTEETVAELLQTINSTPNGHEVLVSLLMSALKTKT